MELPFGDETIPLELPDTMKMLNYAAKEPVQSLNEQEIHDLVLQQIKDPLGMRPPAEILDSSTSIAIVVDDISRPTPTTLLIRPLLSYLIDDLGLGTDQIVFIFGLGVHRDMTPKEAELKLGKEIAETYSWENHSCDDNLVYLGETELGTPIHINKTYHEADFTISIGLIEPHLWAGFSGGHKGIVPGIAGVDTIYHNHKLVRHDRVDVGNLEDNPFREDLEEMVEVIGLDLLINCVLNADKEIHDIVVGDVDKAFKKGVEISRDQSEIGIDQKSDIIISSPNPLGIDFRQSSKAAFNTKNALKRGGYMVVVSECPEGRGNVTASEDPPSRWVIKLLAKILPSKLLMWVIKKQGYGVEDAAGTFRMFKFIAHYNYIFVSPNTSEEDREILFVADHFDTLEEALKFIEDKEGKELTVNVFSQGGATYPVLD